MGHVEQFFGPGNPHVGQTTGFFHFGRIVKRNLSREQSIFHPHHEHDRKFQPLG
ncbi:hypothetical protein DSECCO2_251510 [anaerobic digester metagenome]